MRSVRVWHDLAGLILLSAVCGAAPGGVEYLYDGNDYPENEGWTRYTYDPNSQLDRGVRDGIFTLDTLASGLIYDYYVVTDPALTPGTGQTLLASWRMRVTDGATGWYWSDTMVVIENEAEEHASFYIGTDFISELGDINIPPHLLPIEPQVWHTYLFVSDDLLSYRFYVDGVFAFESWLHGGSWSEGPAVAWGDAGQGAVSSRSEWDYVQVQVVPESSVLTSIAVLFAVTGFRSRGDNRMKTHSVLLGSLVCVLACSPVTLAVDRYYRKPGTVTYLWPSEIAEETRDSHLFVAF